MIPNFDGMGSNPSFVCGTSVIESLMIAKAYEGSLQLYDFLDY